MFHMEKRSRNTLIIIIIIIIIITACLAVLPSATSIVFLPCCPTHLHFANHPFQQVPPPEMANWRPVW